MFDFSGLFDSIENMFKLDYQYGWVTKEALAGYVKANTLTADGYKRITGEDYKA